MNKLLVIAAILAFSGQPVAWAGDLERIQQMEGEIKVMKQASSEQGERIKTLETAVSRDAVFPGESKPAAETARYTDDGPPPQNLRRAQDGRDHLPAD